VQDASEECACFCQLVGSGSLVTFLQLLGNQRLEALGQHGQGASLICLAGVASHGQHNGGHTLIGSQNSATGLEDGQELILERLKVDSTDLTIEKLQTQKEFKVRRGLFINGVPLARPI